MKQLALYYRASNEDAHLGDSVTIQNQRDLLQHYVKNRPEFADWTVVEFQDDGWSGTTFKRPGMQKLLAMAGKDIHCIIVKDFSRFGRNLTEVGHYLDQVFPFLGVRFIAVNENFDSHDNRGRTIGLDVSLRAMIYELYSRDLSKKISSVKEGQMQKGRYVGSWAFYGYQRSNRSTSGLERDPEAAETVKRIFSLAASGVKSAQIAVVLNEEGILPPLSYRRQKNPDKRFTCPTATTQNVWTRHRITAIIQDERYTGVLISKKRQRMDISTKKQKPIDEANWIRAENALEAVITKQTFEQAQKALLRRGKRACSPSSEWFRGLLKCGCCGKALAKVSSKKPYFRCETGRFKPDMRCTQIRVEKKVLEDLLLTALECEIRLILQTENPLDKTDIRNTQMLQTLQKKKEDEKKCILQQALLFEQFADGIIDRTQFSAEKRALSKQLKEITTEQIALTPRLQEKSQAHCASTYDLGKYAFVQSLSRDLLTTFVKRICVLPDNMIEITWNFTDARPVILPFLCRT